MTISDSSPERTIWSHPWLAQALFNLDARLRRRHHVFEYSHNPRCIFRLQIASAKAGCPVSVAGRPGRVLSLHFWNEQIPPLPRCGATFGWAREMQRCIALSLRELDRYLSARPQLSDITHICADVTCGTKAQSAQLARIMAYYGFEVPTPAEHLSWAARLHLLGENILISLIVFVQNAGALRADSLRRIRVPICISRQALRERFGDVRETGDEALR